MSFISAAMVLKPQAVRWWATLDLHRLNIFILDLPSSLRWRRPAEGGMPYAEGGVSDPEGGQQTSLWEAAAASETEDMVRGHWLLTHQLRFTGSAGGIPSGILTLVTVTHIMSHLENTGHLFNHCSKTLISYEGLHLSAETIIWLIDEYIASKCDWRLIPDLGKSSWENTLRIRSI